MFVVFCGRINLNLNAQVVRINYGVIVIWQSICFYLKFWSIHTLNERHFV